MSEVILGIHPRDKRHARRTAPLPRPKAHQFVIQRLCEDENRPNIGSRTAPQIIHPPKTGPLNALYFFAASLRFGRVPGDRVITANRETRLAFLPPLFCAATRIVAVKICALGFVYSATYANAKVARYQITGQVTVSTAPGVSVGDPMTGEIIYDVTQISFRSDSPGFQS